jgi:hypothetical protein|eukprot:scaffold2420_cov208-Alexandrium_tamarense.AAC.8
MKTSAVILLLSATTATAFQAGTVIPRAATVATSTSLNFLEGKGKKIVIREKEDAAMWVDDGQGGRASAEPKKPEPKKPEAKKKSGGFKFPWDK